MATIAPGRVTCAKCGANNFETQAACWKCSAALGSGIRNQGLGNSAANPNIPLSPVPYSPSPSNVDPSAAHWVGIIGGLLIPIAMLPVGLIFLMWDDKRKVEIGRTATIASLVGSLVHAIFTYFAVAGMMGAAMKMLPGMGGQKATSQSEPAPDYNGEAKPLELPGIPSLSPGQN